jgi:hypothetical protein
MASMKAALSAMPRLYRLAGLKACVTCAIVAVSLVAQTFRSALTAQVDPPPLGSHITVAPLADLPSSGDLFSVLDTAIPEVIADRIDSGGLTTGEPARIGAHGSSWTQTRFHVGGVDITDPTGAGTPLLLPQVSMWERVEGTTGLMAIDDSAPGLAIRLTPRRPADAWHRQIAVAGTVPGLLAGRADANPPAVARLDSWLDGDLLAGGPIVPTRVGIVWTATATKATRFERASLDPLDSNLLASFAHLLATPSRTDTVGLIGWGERAQYPVANRTVFDRPFARERSLGAHGQADWNHQADDGRALLSLFGGATLGDRTNDLAPPPAVVMERLRDGPVPELLNPGTGSSRVWTAGGSLTLMGRPQLFEGRIIVGGEVSGAFAAYRPAFSGTVGETLDGLPAHVWQFASTGVDSEWRSLAWNLYASDRLLLHPRLTVEAGARLERITGASATTDRAIAWTGLMPRASARWMIVDAHQITAFGGFGRYGHRLPLSDLAWGDPAAPTGRMFLWNSPNGGTRPPLASEIGALVARVGPGTGGDPAFAAIDPSLRRPHMDEIVTGFDARPTASSFVRLSAIGRRERDLIGAADVGVPESAYTVSYLFDKGVDLVGAQDDQLLPVYNRPRSTFGADRYLLTNPPDDEASFVGADLTYEAQTDHLFLLLGATAGRSEGLSANRGFNAIENDDAVVGEVFVDPNARTFAQGRLFTERGYTLKWSGAYHFPHDATIGAIARYQDGQHFARLVIVPDLDQGPEAIRAFRNGKTRFTYTLTIDVRLQKQIAVGDRKLTLVIDAFNLVNKAKEVEEFPVTGPLSRLTAAVQPPRAIHIGARVTF